MQTIEGFEHFETHHCVTGSLRHIYKFHGVEISEDMLLGLGEGLGFIYWHPKGELPFIGGRANPKPSLEELVGKRTGVKIKPRTSGSPSKAEQYLISQLEKCEPVMIQVDMGFLPYFDFGGEEYHFGGHVVVACGYDSQTITIADRDSELHPVSLAAIAQARSSTYKPFPPKNTTWEFDFQQVHAPTPEAILSAIHKQANLILNPPIRNLGVKGIQKAAELMPQWNKTLTPEQVKWSLFNTYIFICPIGGNGGGAFRYMFSRFLQEAAQLAQKDDLLEASEVFCKIGDEWEAFGEWCKMASETSDPVAMLPQTSAPLEHLAQLEKQAWQDLLESLGD